MLNFNKKIYEKSIWNNRTIENISSLNFSWPKNACIGIIIPPRHDWIIYKSLLLSIFNNKNLIIWIWWIVLWWINLMKLKSWITFIINYLRSKNELVIIIFIKLNHKLCFLCIKRTIIRTLKWIFTSYCKIYSNEWKITIYCFNIIF
jgi:hypothetical protein